MQTGNRKKVARQLAFRPTRPWFFCASVLLTCHAGGAQAEPEHWREVRDINVSEPYLAQSLVSFATQTGVQIIVKGADLGHMPAPSINHQRMPPGAALRILLDHTTLSADWVGSRTLIIAPRPAQLHPVALVQYQAPEPPSPQPPPATAASTGNDIVVTAQRRSERLRDVPVSVSVQTGAMLQQANITSLRDISSAVAGLNFTSQGPFAQPSIRGLSSTGSTAGNEADVSIYLDGAYQPGQQENFFELPDVENVEVLKGPQGTLFGRNATAGAILIHTLDPSFHWSGSGQLLFGAFDRRGLEGSGKGFITGPISDTLAFSVAGIYDHNSGYLENLLAHKGAGRIDSGLIRAKLLFKPSDNLKFVLTGYYQKRVDYNNYSLFEIAPPPNPPYTARPYQYAEDTPGLVKTQSYGATLHADIDLGVGTLTSITAGAQTHALLHINSDGTPAPIATILIDLPENYISQELTFSSKSFGPASVVAGVSAFHDSSRYSPLGLGPTITNPPGLEILSRQTADALAGFGELSYHVTDRLTVIAGLRYSYEQRQLFGDANGDSPLPKLGQASFKAWTPRASVRYEVNSRTNVYFTYSQGFKSGLYDTTQVFAPTATPIQPELIKSYEVGLKSTVLPGLDINAAIFREDIENRQEQVVVPPGLTALSNAASSLIEGAEMDIAWHATPELTLRANASYLPEAKYVRYPNAAVVVPDHVNGEVINKTVDLSGSRLERAQKFQASALANYERLFSWGKFIASANLAYSSPFSELPGNQIIQKSYVLLNATVGWSPPSETSRLSLFAKNLTNETLIQSVCSCAGVGLQFRDPREIGMMLDFKY